MDFIKRYTTDEGIRLAIAVTTDTVEEARLRHDLWPVATAALGRTMMGGLLLASDFKNQENVSIRINGRGPLGAIHVDAFSDNTVRGYVDNPHVDVPLKRAGKLDVGAAVGIDGTVQVTRFTKLRQNYTSQSPLQSGEIAEDLAYYLYTSEQVPSTISLGVLVDPDYHTIVAGGFLLSALPDCSDDVLAEIEHNVNQLGPITAYLKDNPNGEGLKERLLGTLNSNEVFSHDVHFQCTCSRERFLNALLSLRQEDKDEILQDKVTELVCHYCNEKYHYSQEELKALFEKPTHIQ